MVQRPLMTMFLVPVHMATPSLLLRGAVKRNLLLVNLRLRYQAPCRRVNAQACLLKK